MKSWPFFENFWVFSHEELKRRILTKISRKLGMNGFFIRKGQISLIRIFNSENYLFTSRLQTAISNIWKMDAAALAKLTAATEYSSSSDDDSDTGD